MQDKPLFPYGIIFGALGGFGLGFFAILRLSPEVVATFLGVVMIVLGMLVGGFIQYYIVTRQEEKEFWRQRRQSRPYNQDEE
jgi:uncharacterized membrane protein YidH (DUF202 family)